MTETKERRPKRGRWERLPTPTALELPNHLSNSAWMHGLVRVCSSLIVAELPGRAGEAGLQWLISVSRAGKRPKPADVERALRDFGMVGAEQDNHHPGNARHFFLVCDPALRVPCDCKTDEQTIVDRDGYAWTNPIDGECRGCELEQLLGKPCPIHAEGVSREVG